MVRSRTLSAPARAVIAIMAETRTRWSHGYELCQRAGIRSGTLYPLLMRLSDQGLLDSQWQEPERPGKPPRHAYKLTPTGLALAREMAPQKATVRRKLADATT